MNLSRSFRSSVVALFVVIVAGCGGGGGDGESGRPPESPQYDLTGVWNFALPSDCTVLSADLFPSEAAQFELLLESELANDLGSRIGQMGNDLEIVSIESGVQTDGTISGNLIQTTYSAQRMLGGYQIDIYGEGEGTVLNADRIAFTEEGNITVELDGETITIGVVCSYHAVRTF